MQQFDDKSLGYNTKVEFQTVHLNFKTDFSICVWVPIDFQDVQYFWGLWSEILEYSLSLGMPWIYPNYISEWGLSVARIFSGVDFPGDRNMVSAGRKPGHTDQ